MWTKAGRIMHRNYLQMDTQSKRVASQELQEPGGADEVTGGEMKLDHQPEQDEKGLFLAVS